MIGILKCIPHPSALEWTPALRQERTGTGSPMIATTVPWLVLVDDGPIVAEWFHKLGRASTMAES